jgi:hypothetical protein
MGLSWLAQIILSIKLRLYPFMPILVLMDEERYGRPIHIWTIEEILDPPGVSIWFYGLVKHEDGSVTVSEIYPGHGCCNFEISRDDFDKRPEEEVIKEIYADIGYDILSWSPAALKSEYPDAEKVDWEKEIEECMRDAIPFEDYLKQRAQEESGEHRI